MPLTTNVLIQEEEFLDIIDQLRVSIPEEVRQAKKVVQDRDQLIAQGREEAEEIVSDAHKRATEMLEEHKLVKAAEERAAQLHKQADEQTAQILARATSESDSIKIDADNYVLDVLEQLESRLGGMLSTTQNGIRTVRARMEDYSEEEPSTSR